MYLGLSPFDAPATYSLVQYTELADGVWFPVGGIYRVIENLASIAEAQGVRFVYNTPVKPLTFHQNRYNICKGKTTSISFVGKENSNLFTIRI